MPDIISGKDEDYYYQVISVNYNDLKKDEVYLVDYWLLKSINEDVFKEFINKNNLNDDIELDSDKESIIDRQFILNILKDFIKINLLIIRI